MLKSISVAAFALLFSGVTSAQEVKGECQGVRSITCLNHASVERTAIAGSASGTAAVVSATDAFRARQIVQDARVTTVRVFRTDRSRLHQLIRTAPASDLAVIEVLDRGIHSTAVVPMRHLADSIRSLDNSRRAILSVTQLAGKNGNTLRAIKTFPKAAKVGAFAVVAGAWAFREAILLTDEQQAEAKESSIQLDSYQPTTANQPSKRAAQ